MNYCADPFSNQRRISREVRVGNVGVGGDNPIRVQSMLTSDTRDTESCVQEALDLAQCVEWAGTQPWSNGKVGLNGISYYAENQWQCAALQPKHPFRALSNIIDFVLSPTFRDSQP